MNEAPAQLADLGPLVGVYRAKSAFSSFWPLLTLAPFIALSVYLALTAETLGGEIAAAIFALVFIAPLIFVAAKVLGSSSDELRIYARGFTYKTRRRLTECTWSEIANVGAVLDLDDRIKLTSVTRQDGTKIEFAPTMRGRDVLDQRYQEYQFEQIPAGEKTTDPPELDESTEAQPLGQLKGVFRASWFSSVWILVLLAFPTTLAILAAVVTREWLAVGCAVPVVIFFFLVVRMTFLARNEILTIHENGFTYLSRKGLQTCSWNQIVDYDLTTKGSLTGICKASGEYIDFAASIEAVNQLKPFVKKTYVVETPEE